MEARVLEVGSHLLHIGLSLRNLLRSRAMQRLLELRLRRLELATGLLQLGAVVVILEPHKYLPVLHLLVELVLHVGLATNFKAATFADDKHSLLLRELEADIDSVKLDGQDVPVKLKVFDSLFVPLAKWSMLLTGNYRCITPAEPQSIRDAVHRDLKLSQSIYEHVDAVARRLGADAKYQVPFEKYAKAAESLLKPSSAARAEASGAPFIERVDLLVKLISHHLGVPNADIDRTVQIVDQKLNERIVPGGSGAL